MTAGHVKYSHICAASHSMMVSAASGSCPRRGTEAAVCCTEPQPSSHLASLPVSPSTEPGLGILSRRLCPRRPSDWSHFPSSGLPGCCLVTRSCLTLCDPVDCSPPGSSVHEISQAWILEWFAVPSSRGSSRLRDWTCISCIVGGFFTMEPPGKPGLPSACRLFQSLARESELEGHRENTHLAPRICNAGCNTHWLLP